MKLKVKEGYEFYCPECETGMEITEWDTVCDHPSYGWRDIECVFCKQQFFLKITLSIAFQTVKRATDTAEKKNESSAT